MTDPLDVLREPDGAGRPRPGLRLPVARPLERALDLPRGVAVSTATIQLTCPLTPKPIRRAGRCRPGAAIPYLAVADARARDRLVRRGARRRRSKATRSSCRTGVSATPNSPSPAASSTWPTSTPRSASSRRAPTAAAVSLVLTFTDVDARVAAAAGPGGRLPARVGEAYGSRNATIVDPFGHRWMLQQPLTTVPATRGAGRALASGRRRLRVDLDVPDVEPRRRLLLHRARLDRTPNRRSGSAAGGRAVDARSGLFGGQDRPDLFCAYAVGDVDAAVGGCARLAAAPAVPKEEPFGRVSDCVDPKAPSSRSTPRRATPEPVLRSTAPPWRPVLRHVPRRQTPPSARELSTALSWAGVHSRQHRRRLAGRTTSQPMSGLAGGHDEPSVVPMWRSTTSPRPWSGCAPRVARRPIPSSSRTGSPPSASTIRAALLPRPALATTAR